MARSITEIQNIIIQGLAADGIIVSSNKFSRRRIWTFVVANAIYTSEYLRDIFNAEVEEKLRKKNPPTREWYAQTALDFQYGFPLLPGTVDFDNTGYTDAQILASKIIKYAAVIKQKNAFEKIQLRMKLAGSNGSDLIPLTQVQIDAIKAYFDKAEAAGDNLVIISQNYDKLKMKWKVYYNPLILDNQGNRLDGTGSDVVRKAIKSFLFDQSQGGGMAFTGTYVRTYHIDWVQKVAGVVIPKIDLCQAQYGALPFADVDEVYVPDAGWLRFDSDNDLDIQMIPQGAL